MPRMTYKVGGKRVPSVTTLLKYDQDALIYWANKQGLEGKTLQDAREETASPGSMAHERVDAYIKGEDWHPGPWEQRFSSPEAYELAIQKCARAFDNFRRWHDTNKISLIASEVALVSKKHRFGGTLDALGSTRGLCLADWKTGTNTRIYPPPT